MNSYMPHGVCIRWDTLLLTGQVLSNGMIAVSYFLIPIFLISFFRKSWSELSRIFWWFASFIFLCGVTHVMDIVVLWIPLYWAQVIIALCTGVVSLSTAILLPNLVGSLLMSDTRDALSRKVLDLETQIQTNRKKIEDHEEKIQAVKKVDLAIGQISRSIQAIETLTVRLERSSKNQQD